MDRKDLFIKRINEHIADYYELIHDQNSVKNNKDREQAINRERIRLYARIEGMCEACAILLNKQITWSDAGVKIYE